MATIDKNKKLRSSSRILLLYFAVVTILVTRTSAVGSGVPGSLEYTRFKPKHVQTNLGLLGSYALDCILWIGRTLRVYGLEVLLRHADQFG